MGPWLIIPPMLLDMREFMKLTPSLGNTGSGREIRRLNVPSGGKMERIHGMRVQVTRSMGRVQES